MIPKANVGVLGNPLLVDATSATTLQSGMDARTAGFLSGQGCWTWRIFRALNLHLVPGLLGSAWLIGGYGHSQLVAERVVAQLPRDALRDAWLVSSDGDNPRAISG